MSKFRNIQKLLASFVRKDDPFGLTARNAGLPWENLVGVHPEGAREGKFYSLRLNASNPQVRNVDIDGINHFSREAKDRYVNYLIDESLINFKNYDFVNYLKNKTNRKFFKRSNPTPFLRLRDSILLDEKLEESFKNFNKQDFSDYLKDKFRHLEIFPTYEDVFNSSGPGAFKFPDEKIENFAKKHNKEYEDVLYQLVNKNIDHEFRRILSPFNLQSQYEKNKLDLRNLTPFDKAHEMADAYEKTLPAARREFINQLLKKHNVENRSVIDRSSHANANQFDVEIPIPEIGSGQRIWVNDLHGDYFTKKGRWNDSYRRPWVELDKESLQNKVINRIVEDLDVRDAVNKNNSDISAYKDYLTGPSSQINPALIHNATNAGALEYFVENPQVQALLAMLLGGGLASQKMDQFFPINQDNGLSQA